MYDAMLAESVTITGHNGDEIEAYSARALRDGPVGGVVVIHHLPGYDRQTAEFTSAFAAGGLSPDRGRAARGGRGGCGGVPARAEQLQRQGRRDRPLLWRAAGLPRRGQPAGRRGR